MFGSTNPFGQSSSSPFGSPSVFGQNNNASTNPFAAKPFGSTTPFGSQTGGSTMFGGTSTGVFGATQASSPFSSTNTFGASSSPAFGSSTPAFGGTSTPAFGTSSPAFGGSSGFGQKPSFGFGSTAQSSPFGGATPQSQPAFGSSVFGSSTSPFGAPSQSAFGATNTPAFGATNTPAFGATSTPAFGATSTPAFGATSTPAFGSTTSPAFGNTGNGFGLSSSPGFGSGGAFGASSTPAFGASSTPAFGASSTPAFGASGTSAFGASSTPAFGATSTPAFSFNSTPAFGQSTATFGSTSPFGSSSTQFGTQSSPFGAQSSTPAFGSTGFGQSNFGGQQQAGSRVASYTQTTEADSGSGTQAAGKLVSISAMPIHKDKSHEELRWEDYQRGDKGGQLPAGQSPGGSFGAPATQPNPFTPSTFSQSSTNPFTNSTSSNPFGSQTQAFGSTGFQSSTTPFGSNTFGAASSSNLFGSASSATPSLFGSTPAFTGSSSPSPFGSSSTPAFGSSPSLFGTGSAQGTASAFGQGSGFTASQSSPLFNSTAPSTGQNGAFGQNTSPFGQASAPSFGQSSIFNTPSAGFGNLFTNSAGLNTSSNSLFSQPTPMGSTAFQPAQPAQTSGAFGFGNVGQAQPASGIGFAGGFGQNNFGQSPAINNNSAVLQPVAVTNPFGTLPAVPQMSIGRAGTGPSIQYGISHMPVVDKPAPVRISSLLTARHISRRRIGLPMRKYHPNNDGPKVSFFSQDEETPSTPKADAMFIPRENPRALVIRPTEQWPSRAAAERSPLNETTHANGVNGATSNGGSHANKDSATSNGGSHANKDSATSNGVSHANKDKSSAGNGVRVHAAKGNQKPNGVQEDHKGDSKMTLSGHRAGEAAIVYEHGADIEALMPKLRRSDYYTEPRIQELAAKERAEQGYCRAVKNFVVGRHGYGSIKFLGETDVRRLDLESLVQFNNREVVVYMDDSKKPPIGQGLNKPAEVTLLNIKCFDKKTGQQYTEGPMVVKYKGMLKRKAEDQGAEFLSYDPIKGEWKFRVNHF